MADGRDFFYGCITADWDTSKKNSLHIPPSPPGIPAWGVLANLLMDRHFIISPDFRYSYSSLFACSSQSRASAS